MGALRTFVVQRQLVHLAVTLGLCCVGPRIKTIPPDLVRIGVVALLQADALVRLGRVVRGVLGDVPYARQAQGGLIRGRDEARVVCGDVEGSEVEEVPLRWERRRVVQASVTGLIRRDNAAGLTL
jgi:hypothetical protein